MKADSEGNPLVEQYSEEGFVDCTFKISNLKETESHYLFHLLASYKNKTVGMDVEVIKGIQGGFDSEVKIVRDHVYRKGVIFKRSGEESDRLISAIAELYQSKSCDLRMTDMETFTAIALHQDVGDLDMAKNPIKIKIFGNDSDGDSEDDYYESFFNLDLASGYVYWNEKDEDYRDPLIRSLSK